MSRTVTGTLLLPNGQPMANARIFFTAKRTEAISIVEGVNAFFDTNGSGAYNQEIVDGWYGVSIEWQADSGGATVRRWQLGDAVVEAGASTSLEALIIASNPTASVESTLLYEVLQQAQQARDEAEAAANAAAASAATISPTKQAQWDQAFAERNRWDGSSAGLNASAGRASLGLGTASQANVVTSATDTTSGNVPLIGWMGMGTHTPPTQALSSVANVGIFAAAAGDTDNPMGSTQPYLNFNVSPNYGGMILMGRSGAPAALSYGVKYRTKNAGTFNDWQTFWDTGNLVKTESPRDRTTGRMLQVDAGGLLGTSGLETSSTPLNDYPIANGFINGSAMTEETPLGVRPMGIQFGATAGNIVQLGGGANAGPDLRFRKKIGAAWAGPFTFYHTGNTSADVQAMLGAANNAAIRSAISASSLPPYALSTVPSAAANTNLLIVVTDLTGGREPCFSDGTNWLRCSDKSIAN